MAQNTGKNGPPGQQITSLKVNMATFTAELARVLTEMAMLAAKRTATVVPAAKLGRADTQPQAAQQRSSKI